MAPAEVAPATVMDALRAVYDGCCEERKISIVDMGLVEAVRVIDGDVLIELVLTTGWCPFSGRMLDQARRSVSEIPGVREVRIDLNWDKTWDHSRVDARLADSFRLLPDVREAAELRNRCQFR